MLQEVELETYNFENQKILFGIKIIALTFVRIKSIERGFY